MLQWGDVLEVHAQGQLMIGGQALGPDGIADTPLWNTSYPLHAGLDASAAAHGLLARLNNYVLIGAGRTILASIMGRGWNAPSREMASRDGPSIAGRMPCQPGP